MQPPAPRLSTLKPSAQPTPAPDPPRCRLRTLRCQGRGPPRGEISLWSPQSPPRAPKGPPKSPEPPSPRLPTAAPHPPGGGRETRATVPWGDRALGGSATHPGGGLSPPPHPPRGWPRAGGCPAALPAPGGGRGRRDGAVRGRVSFPQRSLPSAAGSSRP